jgi:ribonuclease P/MRP protein subunit RPP1
MCSTPLPCHLAALLLFSLAFERNIHFEFSYAPSIRDSASRRYLFSNILAMLRLTRGRNLVLSSAAAREMEIRAPWDVINLSVRRILAAAHRAPHCSA